MRPKKKGKKYLQFIKADWNLCGIAEKGREMSRNSIRVLMRVWCCSQVLKQLRFYDKIAPEEIRPEIEE